MQANKQTHGIPMGGQNKVQKKPISGFKEIRNQTELHQQSAPGCTKEREPRTCSAMSRESMTVWDSRFQAVTDFRIPGTGFQSLSLELEFWILIVTGFLKLYSGLQSPGFRIPQAKFSGFRIPQAKVFRIPESGFPFMG